MTPAEFVRKWRENERPEVAAYVDHFNDICRLLHRRSPNEADPKGRFFAFQKLTAKSTGGTGFADVWYENHFAWEYKGKQKNLSAAYQQLLGYHDALGNPPLLIACDFLRFQVRTKWTNTDTWLYEFTIDDLLTDRPIPVVTLGRAIDRPPELPALAILAAAFEEPERLMPFRTREQITAEAARLFGQISDELRKWRLDDMRVARLITQLIFCMFADDVGLLSDGAFAKVIENNRDNDRSFRSSLAELFRAMNTGGMFGPYRIDRFNGRLFQTVDVPDELAGREIQILAELARLDWSDVEPSIFGTLFERVLDPEKRALIGAHYTSREDIELIVEPVLMGPLRSEWDQVRSGEMGAIDAAVREFHEKLSSIRVLDPACGSGNFLYISLALLKDLEREVVEFARMRDAGKHEFRVRPGQLLGIEINPFARELAAIVVWIGYLQWKRRNGLLLNDEVPVLEPLDHIELRDAILDRSVPGCPAIPAWPTATVIVGNPPFLGGKRLRSLLKDEYVDDLFRAWNGRVSRTADLCCYWFEQARSAIERGDASRAGLLATQAIRNPDNRRVLERIKETGDIFYAQRERLWPQDKVMVRVSMIGFDDGSETQRVLGHDRTGPADQARKNAHSVEGINANLTSQIDVGRVPRLRENAGICFMGDTKGGPFDVPEVVARWMLLCPNPHGFPNRDVVRPWANGIDIAGHPRNMWIIDFGTDLGVHQAALYEEPFKHVLREVKPVRAASRSTRAEWWLHERPRGEMRRALSGLRRYIATPNLTKYRFFVWLTTDVLPDHQLIVFARDDDYFFGVLHSHAHEVWARATGTQLRDAESGFRYTPTTCFETFPFPTPTLAQAQVIAEAACALNGLRTQRLSAAIGPLDSPTEARRLTLTRLYNERPTWLTHLHQALDEAVFDAYGWPIDVSDDEILARLFTLNSGRAAAEESGRAAAVPAS